MCCSAASRPTGRWAADCWRGWMPNARAAIDEHVGRPLGLDPQAAAEAILTVANAKMAGAIRVVSIERGHDPRKFAYMPFGGGGALHVCALMREVGCLQGIVPRFPGVTSALGCVMADMRHDSVQTLNTTLAGLDEADLARRVQALADSCQQRLDSAGVAFEGVRERIELDMLYAGQSHTVNVPVERQALTRTGIAAAFEAAYRRAYGRSLDGMPVRVLNLRYARIGMRPKFDLAVLAPTAGAMPAVLARRPSTTAGNGGTRRVTNGWRCPSTRKWPARPSWNSPTPRSGSSPASSAASTAWAIC